LEYSRLWIPLAVGVVVALLLTFCFRFTHRKSSFAEAQLPEDLPPRTPLFTETLVKNDNGYNPPPSKS
jgi:hypothetical protein